MAWAQASDDLASVGVGARGRADSRLAMAYASANWMIGGDRSRRKLERQMKSQRFVERGELRCGQLPDPCSDPLDGDRPHLLGLGLGVARQSGVIGIE